jgi:hypothetical protein
MYKAFFLIIFLLGFNTLVNAQSPKVELFAGYTNVNSEFSPGLNGFTTSVNGSVTKNVGVVADFSVVSRNGSTGYLALFGPRYSFRTSSKVTPFVHALFGAIGPDAAFAMNFGGGIDVKLSKRFSLRAIQADFIQLRNGANSTNTARISTGIVFNFGEK